MLPLFTLLLLSFKKLASWVKTECTVLILKCLTSPTPPLPSMGWHSPTPKGKRPAEGLDPQQGTCLNPGQVSVAVGASASQ